MELTGVSAVVTGGASGLGAATAALLARGGAKVTIFDLNEEAGRPQAHAVGGRGQAPALDGGQVLADAIHLVDAGAASQQGPVDGLLVREDESRRR